MSLFFPAPYIVCYDHADCHLDNTRCSFAYEDCDAGRCECQPDYYMTYDGQCKKGKHNNIQYNVRTNCM